MLFNKTYNYQSLEEANKAYDNFTKLCVLGKSIGYSFKYELKKEDTKVTVNIKHQLNLN